MTKNINYRALLDTGQIKEIITEETLIKILDNIMGIRGRHIQEARALVILLYYTGARPAEVLEITPSCIQKDASDIIIYMKTKKRGTPRLIYLDYRKPMVREVYDWVKQFDENLYVFFHYKGRHLGLNYTKDGVFHERVETSANLRYHFKIWVKDVITGGIPPYYLRHNRFTKLALKGATDRELMQMKGSRTIDSLKYYIHSSAESAKKLKRIND